MHVLHRHGRAEDVWTDLGYSPVLDDNGKPAGVLAIVVETTQRVVGEHRLRAFVAATSDAVFRVSGDWSEMRYLEGNRFIADTRTPDPDWVEKYIPHIRLVALTGYGRSEDREKTQAAGFNDHLVKPVDMSALMRALTDRR